MQDNILAKEGEITDLIRERWKKGERPDGSAIGVYRDHEYADYKYQLNPEAGYGFVDLREHGDLERGLHLSGPSGTVYDIYSRDEKFNKIADKYGDDNFDLSPEETEEILDSTEAEILDEILQQTYK